MEPGIAAPSYWVSSSMSAVNSVNRVDIGQFFRETVLILELEVSWARN